MNENSLKFVFPVLILSLFSLAQAANLDKGKLAASTSSSPFKKERNMLMSSAEITDLEKRVYFYDIVFFQFKKKGP